MQLGPPRAALIAAGKLEEPPGAPAFGYVALNAEPPRATSVRQAVLRRQAALGKLSGRRTLVRAAAPAFRPRRARDALAAPMRSEAAASARKQRRPGPHRACGRACSARR